eukprot:6868837-Prymnesium_polylepis.1
MSACTRKRATFQAECSKNYDSNMAAKSDRPNIGSGASTGASRVTRPSRDGLRLRGLGLGGPLAPAQCAICPLRDMIVDC